MNRLFKVKNFFVPLYKGTYQNHGLTHLNLAFFCYIAAFSNVYSFPKNIAAQYGEIYIYLYVPTLILSIILITYPIWLTSLQHAGFISVIWYFSIFYNLIFVNTIYTILADFSPMQLIILMAGLLLTALVLSWQRAVVMICGGTILAYQFCMIYLSNFITTGVPNVYPKIIYFLILTTAILIAFLRPKQIEHELSEEMVGHLSYQVKDQSKQILNLSTLKQTFLMNLQHETNTPLTGVFSMSQALADCYDKLSDEQRKNAIESIKGSSERLISYVHNLVDVSKLTTQKFKLDIRKVKLSRLLEDSIRKCKRLYIPKETEEDRDIILDINPNITINCDEYLIKRSFENIIINAIQYCKKGTIEIKLRKVYSFYDALVIFTVTDQGIGIPKEELIDIFEPFAVSSRTRTPAGGRGVGLTFVKEAVKAHRGSVVAESGGKTGSLFTMTIPENMA